MDVLAEIRKRTAGAHEETQFDVRDVTSQAPYQIKGATVLTSSHQFHIDPTPWNVWVVIDDLLRTGSEIADILRERNIAPSSKKEAIAIAELIMFGKRLKAYPNFNDRMDTGARKPKAKKREGVYEVVLYTAAFPYTRTFEQTIRLGQGICEVTGEPSVKKKAGKRGHC